MDPLSAGASVAQLVSTIAAITKFVHRIQRDTKNAPFEVEEARQHALLLQREIEGVRALKDKARKEDETPFGMSTTSTAQAVAIAESLMTDIQHSFPAEVPAETLKGRLRWALEDKAVVSKLSQKLRETESSLQTILQLEQSRITKAMWSVLLRQSGTLARIEQQTMNHYEEFTTTMTNQHNPVRSSANIHVSIQSTDPDKQGESIQLKGDKTRLDREGFSAGLVLSPKNAEQRYGLSLRLSMLSREYSVEFRINWFALSFASIITTRNIISKDSAIVKACSTGNSRRAQQLLLSGQAHPNDVSCEQWPLLDYAIQGGSTRIVQLLLDNGADANVAFDQSLMTPLQSAFMRGRHDVAEHLIRAGADIDHVDKDGFSALSYLWVVDGPLQNSASFLRMCATNGFDVVNSVDERGWSPLHRAAAVGTAEDIHEFFKLGASTDLRTDWYGWTPLFFAASHDNVETFKALALHDLIDVNDYLDGDGWNLLHCAVYFGAPNIVRTLLDINMDVDALTKPAPMLEDPELAYLALTARDIAIYMGPERYKMYTDALADSGLDAILDGYDDIFWDADEEPSYTADLDGTLPSSSVYGAEDVDDHWTLLHWASYCGSEKIKRLLLMKGANPRHQAGITAYLPPSLDDLDTAPPSYEYIQGSVARPFHGPSPALRDSDALD